eukprot:UN11622
MKILKKLKFYNNIQTHPNIWVAKYGCRYKHPKCVRFGPFYAPKQFFQKHSKSARQAHFFKISQN